MTGQHGLSARTILSLHRRRNIGKATLALALAGVIVLTSLVVLPLLTRNRVRFIAAPYEICIHKSAQGRGCLLEAITGYTNEFTFLVGLFSIGLLTGCFTVGRTAYSLRHCIGSTPVDLDIGFDGLLPRTPLRGRKMRHIPWSDVREIRLTEHFVVFEMEGPNEDSTLVCPTNCLFFHFEEYMVGAEDVAQAFDRLGNTLRGLWPAPEQMAQENSTTTPGWAADSA